MKADPAEFQSLDHMRGSVLNQIQRLVPVLRVFFPEQRKWVARVFIVTGMPLTAGQVWEPYANALLAHYADVRVPIEAATTTGWIFLLIGLIVFVGNEILDRLPKKETATAADELDRRALDTIFSEMHLPTMDLFIHYGKLSMAYYPVFHYFHGLEGFVQASSYHIHDANLKLQVDALYSSLKKSLSFGQFFTETSSPHLYKFDSRRDVHVNPQARTAHDEFVAAVYDVEKHLRALCSATQQRFPDFNLTVTNARAAENYRSYHDEAWFK